MQLIEQPTQVSCPMHTTLWFVYRALYFIIPTPFLRVSCLLLIFWYLRNKFDKFNTFHKFSKYLRCIIIQNYLPGHTRLFTRHFISSAVQPAIFRICRCVGDMFTCWVLPILLALFLTCYPQRIEDRRAPLESLNYVVSK